MTRIAIAAGVVLALAPMPVLAQQPGNGGGAPPAASTDVGNWGLLPFSVGPSIVLDEEGRKALRTLQDKHLAELRALEDRVAEELLNLRTKQAQERAELLGRIGR